MEYTYYPGCSLHSSAPAYEHSTQAVMNALGAKLVELEDWNCCGATAYMSIKELTAFTISARNLALAKTSGRDVVAPCSGCFVGLTKANKYINEFPEVREKVNLALAEAGLSYDGGVKVRHLLDIIINDVTIERLKTLVKRPLTGLKVACYYGCQLVRPKTPLDDPEEPKRLEELIAALGATPTYFPMKANCCGGSIMGTEESIGVRLSKNITECAVKSGAECMVCPCPLCQMNLDAYQPRINRTYGKDFKLPILYFTQLIGLALGLQPKDLGFGTELVGAEEILKRFS
jgi:heterodisulfide reductase subunit B